MNGETFVAWLAELRPRVDAALDEYLPDAEALPARLHAAMRYACLGGGKRVRPALVVLVGESLGAGRDRLMAGAAAIEMIHTFSLVHDDLPSLDDDDLRRGRATTHREYDEATAVLVGDALLNRGLEIFATHPPEVSAEDRLRAVSLVTGAVGTNGMIGGQMADLEAEDSWPEDAAAALESIHRRKTGALLEAAVRLGGIYGGAGEALDGVLSTLGADLGLLFQVGDDILDVEGSSSDLGKTANKDAGARKLTYPGLYGLDGAKHRLVEVRDRTLAHLESWPGDRELLRSLVAYLTSRDR